MTSVTLPIYCHTSQTSISEDVGIAYKIRDGIVREIPFYQIALLEPYFDEDDNGREYSVVHANGTTFMCKWTVKQVQEEIESKHVITVSTRGL